MYLIYKYTAPDNRVYIGCTSRTLKQRSGDHGEYYKDAPRFWAAIQEFGWENFSVEILAQTEDAAEAAALEDKYIAQYNSRSTDYGFNTIHSGGARSIEARQKQSARMKEILNAPDSYFRSQERYEKQSAGLKRAFSNPEVRARMSAAGLRNKEQYRQRMLGRKGIYKAVDGTYISKYVFPDQLEEYFKQGWKLGKRPDKINRKKEF